MKRTLTLILLFFVCITNAQQKTEQDIKVGLVLSGGGAKGLAHIGALKIIDSLEIRIDYVAGTSMGAIIGALYASGYSGKQLDSIFEKVNFNDIISDNLPRASKTFYERDNSERYAITLPFEKFKIKLPSGLSSGQNSFGLFSKLTLHVNNIKDFSKLPIPFFCIATNVETGKPVVLDKGNLAQAISASGAFPSLFQPVIIGDQILIDGGVVNNYPIDELKDKGVDLIIGVDVQDNLVSRKNLTSAPDILFQINNFRTIKDMEIKSKKTDIYIKPDIDDFSVISFSEGKKIISNGEIATRKNLTALKEIVVKQLVKKKDFKVIKATDSLQINNIVIEGNEKYTRAYILGKLKFKPNEKISYRNFISGVNNIEATNNFDYFTYSLNLNEKKGAYDLYVKVNESKTTTFIKLGLHYDDLYKSAALVNLTKKQTLFKNDVTSLDIILGDNVRYNFDYFIDKGFYWSVGLKSRYNTFHKSINVSLLLDEDDIIAQSLNKIDVELSDLTNQFYLQTLFRKDFALTLGAEHKRLKITSETFIDTNTNEEETTFERSDFFSLFGKLKFDTYNNKYFPKEGFLFDGDFHLFFSSSDFNNNFSQFSFAKAKIGYAFSLSNKLAVNIESQGGFKIGEDSNNSLNFALGGYGNNFINNFVTFYGYDYISIAGSGFVKGTINIDYEIFKNQHLIFSANFANVGDNIFDNGNWFSTPEYSGYAIGCSTETFLGPIEVKYTWTPDTKSGKWFFNLGFWF
ncbi:MAG: patatin-like phospholipase family protein [Flavobacteriaceae bacterium]|nr:patatin-like phospholipase family protein [Flavobacteriaceae bacterium]